MHYRRGYFWFYFWYILFFINDVIFSNPKFEAYCWQFIKDQLFYVSGRCRHTGYCCSHMKIIVDGQAVDTPSKFDRLKNKVEGYSRFIPFLLQSKVIKYFKCSSLSNYNRCLDYKNRPTICRQYPYSNFYYFDHIREECGYHVQRTSIRPLFFSIKLRNYVSRLESLNRINS